MACELSKLTSEFKKNPNFLETRKTRDANIKALAIKVGKPNYSTKVLGALYDSKDEVELELKALEDKLNSFGEIKFNPDNGEVILSDIEKTIHNKIKNLEDVLSSWDSQYKNVDPYEDYEVPQMYKFQGDNSHDRSKEPLYEDWVPDIKHYTGVGYVNVNREARGGRLDSGIVKFLQTTDENFDGATFRGTRIDVKQSEALISALKQGAILSNKTPLSTSTSFNEAHKFLSHNPEEGKRDFMLTIRGSGHDISNFSDHPQEQEVLMKPGKFYQILDTYETDMQVHLLLEEVPEHIVKEMKVPIEKGVLGLLAGIGLHQSQTMEE